MPLLEKVQDPFLALLAEAEPVGANPEAPLAPELRRNGSIEQPVAAMSEPEPNPAVTVVPMGFWCAVAPDGLDEGLNERPMLETDAEAEKDAEIAVPSNIGGAVAVTGMKVCVVVLDCR